VRLPFPAGFGDAEYAQAYGELVAPILRQFAPDFVLISAGFDSDHRDPLDGMMVTPAGFGVLARLCADAAAATAGGRIAAVLEGGYDLDALVVRRRRADARRLPRRATAPGATGDARRAERVIARVRAMQAPSWSV
jgi:acetoin utilization deacetylase AcuC-like enzyme